MFDLRKEQQAQADLKAEAQAPNTRFVIELKTPPQPDGLAPDHTAPPTAPAGLLPAPAVLQSPYSGQRASAKLLMVS